MNGKILTLPFRLLKFTGFLERFLILPDLREGLPCVTPLGDVPSTAQWHSKSFPPAVAAAGLGNQHPGWFAGGKRAGEREANKSCMAATLLLPESSYRCCSALRKNVTSLHCSALGITHCTLCLGWFGVTLAFQRWIWLAKWFVWLCSQPFLLSLSISFHFPLSLEFTARLQPKLFKAQNTLKVLHSYRRVRNGWFGAGETPHWSSRRGKSTLPVVMGVFPEGCAWPCSLAWPNTEVMFGRKSSCRRKIWGCAVTEAFTAQRFI